MKIKKTFALYDYQEENKFLQEQYEKGYILDSLEEGIYHFKKRDYQSDEAVVHYSMEAYSPEEGVELLFSYPSAKGGYYHYLIVSKGMSLDPSDRNSVLELDLNRIERYTAIILLALLGFFLYLLIEYKNPIYLLVLIPGAILSLYTAKIRSKIKLIIK